MKNYESLSHTRYDCKYHVVFKLLNGTSANNPTCKETRNPDGPENVGFNPDGKPGLLTERGEAVLTRHVRGRPRSSCRP